MRLSSQAPSVWVQALLNTNISLYVNLRIFNQALDSELSILGYF